MKTDRRVRCRWCDWTHALYDVHGADGLQVGGWEELKLHVQMKHPAQFKALEAWLGSEPPEYAR